MTNPDQNEFKKSASSFAKYTGIAVQMLATIGILSFIGYKIDQYKGNTNLIFTAIFGIVGVVGSLVQVVRSLNKNNDQ